MPFEKGHNLSKGRPKGSPNKIDGTTKQFLQDLIDDNTDKIKTELEGLKGKAFLDAVFNFMEYVQPKLSRSEVKAEISRPVDLSNIDSKLLNELDKQLNEGTDTSGDS